MNTLIIVLIIAVGLSIFATTVVAISAYKRIKFKDDIISQLQEHDARLDKLSQDQFSVLHIANQNSQQILIHEQKIAALEFRIRE